MKVWPCSSVDAADRTDVGAIERGRRLRLSDQAGLNLLVVDSLRREELERDGAAELCVFGPVDDTHAVFAELFGHLVMADGLADQDRPILAPNGYVVKTNDRMNDRPRAFKTPA